MGNLQRLVFELIFSEIKKEMQRAEDLKRSFYDLEYDDPDLPPEERMALRRSKSAECVPDNYCFEMLCMILDLTSAQSGQKFIGMLSLDYHCSDSPSLFGQSFTVAVVHIVPNLCPGFHADAGRAAVYIHIHIPLCQLSCCRLMSHDHIIDDVPCLRAQCDETIRVQR